MLPAPPPHPLPRLIALLAATLLGVGCAAGEPVPNPMTVDAQAYDRAFDAARQVVRDQGFMIDEDSHRFGRLTTQPRFSPTIFEPWGRDNRTLSLAAASTLNLQRRTITVLLEPIEDQPLLDVRVEVLLERQQEVTHQLSGSVGRNVFSRVDRVPAEWSQRGIERRYWEPVGRDEHMEAALLRRIATRLEIEPTQAQP